MKQQMKAVRIYGPGEQPVTETVPVPKAGPGEVLVQMTASPINPSDLVYIREGYLVGSWPVTAGLEGSGVVVDAGRGLLPRIRKGRAVACSPIPGRDGTWAEYMVTSATRVVPLPADLDPLQGAMMLVNPMTALAFIDMARKGRHAAMVNNAAASALGRILIRLSRRYGIPLISIVRKQDQVEKLKELGAEHVLNSSLESYEDELRELCGNLNATLILDAVGGPGTAALLHAAPKGARLVVYARLSGDQIQARGSDLMIPGKTIAGFQLGAWLNSNSLLFNLRFIGRVKKLLDTHMSTEIAGTYALEEADAAIQAYTGNMSAGKYLLVPNPSKT